MGKLMVKRLGSVFFLIVVGLCAACQAPDVDPAPVDKMKNKILEGKYSLSQFEADRARDIFLEANQTWRKTHAVDHCEAAYGVVLADAQVAVKLLNGLVIRPLLTGALAPAPYAPNALPETRGGYRTAAGPHDFGIEAENLWASFEPYLNEMALYAGAVTQIPNCTFSIGVGEEPVDELKNDENPYKWVLNLGDTEQPIVQLVFRGRLDGAEARVVETLTRSIMGAADYVLAHDLSLTIDVAKIAYLLGAPVDCVRADALDCITKILNDEVPTQKVDLLEAAFIFADNPKLLTKNLEDPAVIQSNRWERRFSQVDNQFARAFYAFRSFFPALVARSAQLQSAGIANSEVFDQYLMLYVDENEDGKVDAGDTFGFNLASNGSGVKLSCDYIIRTRNLSASDAQTCRNSMSDLEDAITTGLSVVKELFTPSEEAISDINTFADRMYGNMAAVDNPSITAERIPINQFDNVIRDFLLELVNQPTPPFMEFDVKAFFVDAKPLRDFLPYWERTTTAWTYARFIADSDDYLAFKDADPNTDGCQDGGGPYTQLTAPQLLFDQNYTNLCFKLKSERSVLQGPYDEGRITNLALPADCLNPNNLYAELSASIGSLDRVPGTVMYLPLGDPSLNAMIYINMDEWSLLYGGDNGANKYDNLPLGPGPEDFSCSDPSGFQLADNQTLTKSMWLYLDFLADHIQLIQLLGPIIGALGM